jgi:hypothetical protein
VGSVAEPERTKRCPSCGDEFGDPGRDGRDRQVVAVGAKIPLLGDDVLLCVRCIGGVRSQADWGYPLPTKEDSPLPLQGSFDELLDAAEELFDELFMAARVLLGENAEEKQIIPTLALANHLCHGVPRLVREKDQLVGVWGDERAWDEEADGFARRFSGLQPVQVARGALILERQPVSISIGRSVADGNPVAVVVRLYPHQTTLAKPEDVASLYGKRLSDAGISSDEKRTGNLSFHFRNGRLELDITPGTVVERIEKPKPGFRTDKASFPHPSLVRSLYSALRDEFRGDLATRPRSHPPKAKNLVPACVAFFLREEYGIAGRMIIHRLLNEHVLCEIGKSLPEGHSTSEETQLWKSVGNNAVVRDPLLDASWTLFWEGCE